MEGWRIGMEEGNRDGGMEEGNLDGGMEDRDGGIEGWRRVIGMEERSDVKQTKVFYSTSISHLFPAWVVYCCQLEIFFLGKKNQI